jgi:hypothetical protein
MVLKRIKLLLSLCCFLFVCGCYESQFPLSSSDTSRIDERLVKSWIQQTSQKNDDPYRVVIRKFNEHEYVVAFSDMQDKEAQLVRAFTTMIDSAAVINLQGINSLAPKDRTFLFFKYVITPQGNLRVWMIDKESPLLRGRTFAAQAELYAFIKKNIHNDTLYREAWEFKPAEGIKLEMSCAETK